MLTVSGDGHPCRHDSEFAREYVYILEPHATLAISTILFPWPMCFTNFFGWKKACGLFTPGLRLCILSVQRPTYLESCNMSRMAGFIIRHVISNHNLSTFGSLASIYIHYSTLHPGLGPCSLKSHLLRPLDQWPGYGQVPPRPIDYFEPSKLLEACAAKEGMKAWCIWPFMLVWSGRWG